MAELRTCVYLLVLLVLFQRTFATPIFGSSFFCPLFCDYGDDDDSGGGSFVDDLLSLFGDSSEETSTPETNPGPGNAAPAAGNAKPQEISLSIPPANGMNLTLQSLGSSLLLSLFPWSGGSSATTAAPTTSAPTTPAGNATAANATAA